MYGTVVSSMLGGEGGVGGESGTCAETELTSFRDSVRGGRLGTHERCAADVPDILAQGPTY